MRTHRHDALDQDAALRRRARTEATDDRAHDPSPGLIGGVMRLQRTLGNQAVQRLIQRDGLLPEWSIDDWTFEPKPTSETDDRYDNEENRRRAEQKDADERGQSPTPRKWWEPQKPGPAPKPGDRWDPMNWPKRERPSNAGSPGEELEIPPPGPDERGDYPYPAPIEPDDAQYA